MIKFREQVPSVYTSASRDFQYLSWLIDIVLNSVKHNVDGLYELPNTKIDPRLSELLAMTLGFKVKRNYDQKQLAALVAVLPRIIKYKGTITAINMAGKALIAASGATGSIISTVSNGELSVSLPKNLVDISLFTDLLPYILPAGMTCHIIRTDIIQKVYTTKVGYTDVAIAELVPDLTWNSSDQTSTGLATMFNTGMEDSGDPTFASFKNSDKNMPNFGLLDNSIIPSLEYTLNDQELDYAAVLNDSTTVTVDKGDVEKDDNSTINVGGD
jgi:hypothetical protein